MLRIELQKSADSGWTVIQGDRMGLSLTLGEMLEAVTHAAYTESPHRYLDAPEKLAKRREAMIKDGDNEELKAIHAHLERIKATKAEPDVVW